ncbi:MAG: hypothetical protein HZA01_14940 [Nitrospinae bacterium]|nr:hypothetical protein [Nitrospinota bacterium]
MSDEAQEAAATLLIDLGDDNKEEDIKEALDRSSSLNRNLLLFFLPAMFYIN